MPKDPLAANAQAMPDDQKVATPDQIAAREAFEAAYCEWLTAKAASCDQSLDQSDAVANKRYDRVRAAEIALIATPAPIGWQVLQKLEFVESMIAHNFEAGEPKYPLAILALAAVKADMLAIGFKEG